MPYFHPFSCPAAGSFTARIQAKEYSSSSHRPSFSLQRFWNISELSTIVGIHNTVNGILPILDAETISCGSVAPATHFRLPMRMSAPISMGLRLETERDWCCSGLSSKLDHMELPSTYLKILVVILLFIPVKALASFELIPLSSRQEAMGGVSGGYGFPGALWLNPASAAKVSRTWMTFTHSRWWSMPELSLSSVSVSHPLSLGNVSAAVSSYGYSTYRETIVCLSLARVFRESLNAGMNVKWMQRSIGKDTDNTPSFDVGLLLRPIEEISMEVSSHHVGTPTIGTEPLYQDLLIGVIYQPENGLLIGASLLKQPPYEVQLCMGEEYKLTDWLIQRAGVRQNPRVMTFGFGIDLSSILFDYAAVIHKTLGTTHSFSLSMAKFWGE